MRAAPSGSWGGRRLSLGGSVTVMGATDGATVAGQGEPTTSICKRLRIDALERGIESQGLELFTFDSTTGEGSQ